jgi:lipopolysaccharide transport system permease protein
MSSTATFVTPIIYPASFIPERFQWLLAFNPLAWIIEAFRHVLVPTQAIHWDTLGLSLAVNVAVFVVGIGYFRQTERAFADII